MRKEVIERSINGELTREQGEDNRRFSLSFSSEEPVIFCGTKEILSHDIDAVDLTRVKEFGVVLFNHDRDEIVAKIEKVWLENNKGKAVIYFDDDDKAEKIRKKVESETLKGVSVGYRVSKWEEVAAGEKSEDGRFEGPAFIARKWCPLEISVVSVPADINVGINRELTEGEGKEMKKEENATLQEKENVAEQKEVQKRGEKEALNAINEKKIRSEAVSEEKKRAAEINDMCKDFNIDPTEHIKGDASVDSVRQDVLNEMKKKRAPVEVQVMKDEGDKFREAAIDSLLMRGGIGVEKPAIGAERMRNLSFRNLLNECARRDGAKNPEYESDPITLMRQYFTPTSAFPAILDQTIQKAYEKGYQTAPTTFEEWTTKGSLSDFKTTRSSWKPGNAGEFLIVPEGGELKHDVVTDALMPQRKLNTYGRQFTMSREAIINDDIGFLTSLPARYAASARRTINKQAYSVLVNNAVVFDGVPLFDKAHANYVKPGTKPTLESLQEMIKLLMLMKDENKDPIANVPRYVLVPIGLGDAVRQLVSSETLIKPQESGGYLTSNNPLAGRSLIVIEDAFLNTLSVGSNIAWYVASDKTIVPTIQIDYLNGQEKPTIRRMEYPGQLGYIWDVYLDWGVTVLDYRGIIKNDGKE